MLVVNRYDDRGVRKVAPVLHLLATMAKNRMYTYEERTLNYASGRGVLTHPSGLVSGTDRLTEM